MARNDEITINLYKIDSESILTGKNIKHIDDVPATLVKDYNNNREDGLYKPIESANVSPFSIKNKMHFYKKLQSSTVTHSWANFFNKEATDLGDVKSATPNIVCFVTYENEVYAFTTGSANVVFETHVDQTYPIELAKRIVNPALKGGKQQSISGVVQASDIYFRRPTRINAASSHQEVWKNLSGSLKNSIRESEEFRNIFGLRRSVGVEIKSSIKISTKTGRPDRILKLISWFDKLLQQKLTDEQKSSFSFYDAIRPLNARRDKHIINKLTQEISTKFLSNGDENSFSICHEKNSQFINAERYTLRLSSKPIYEWDSLPAAEEVAKMIKKNKDKTKSEKENLEKFQLTAHYEDAGYLNTQDSVLRHLSGELVFESSTFYLLNGSWFKVEKVFQTITDNELHEVLKNTDNMISNESIGLSAYSHSGEPEYNKSQASSATIIADAVFYKGLELADILEYGDDEVLNIVHVKRGLNATVRELASQLRNAIDTIENDLNIADNPALNDYYKHLRKNGRLNAINEKDFVNLFLNRKRRYIFAYINKEPLSHDLVNKMGSSIAKNEIVSIIQYGRQLRQSASVHLLWIPNEVS